ncbi:MAG: HNH endonuclease [Fusobacterium sp.]
MNKKIVPINIKGFEHYFVDEDGNTYALKNGIYKKKNVSIDRYGYCYSSYISKDKQQKKLKNHRIVAMTFIQNPDNKPTVNHIDGNKLNNHISNLEWSTNKEQQDHAVKIGLRQNKNYKNIYVFNNDLELIDICKDTAELKIKYKMAKSFITGSLKKEYYSKPTKYNVYISLKNEKPKLKPQKYNNIQIKELNDNKYFNSIKEASDYYKLKNCFIIEGLRNDKEFYHKFKNGQPNRSFNFKKVESPQTIESIATQ